MVRYRASNAFATLPFDQLDGTAGLFVHEDFEQAPILADFVDGTGVIYNAGNTLWWGNEVAGGAVSNITVPVSVADHVGIIKLEVGSTSPADGDAAALQFGGVTAATQDSILLDDNGVYIATVLRIPDVDAQVSDFGMYGQTPSVPNSSSLDGIAWVWDPEDSANVGDEFWIAQVNGAGTDVEKVSGLNYVEADWVLLEIGADSSQAVFRITTEDGTETITIDATDGAAMPLVALRPGYVVENVGANEEVLDIDLFHMRYLRRDVLKGKANDWLGQ